jgi:hypothetical protein
LRRLCVPRIRPAGGDAGADRIPGPEVDNAAGIGIVADGIAGPPRHRRRRQPDLGSGAAAGWGPGRGPAVLRGGVAANRFPARPQSMQHPWLCHRGFPWKSGQTERR